MCQIYPNLGVYSQKTLHISLLWTSYEVSIVMIFQKIHYALTAWYCTIWSHYGTVNFLWNILNRCPVACPWRWSMRCLLWVGSLLSVPFLSWLCCMQYCATLDHVLMWPTVFYNFDGLGQDCSVSYTRACKTNAGCLRSIYPSLGIRQLFGDITMAQWRHS